MYPRNDDISTRKKTHLELARNPEAQMDSDSFADYQLPYNPLPEISLEQVDTTTNLLGTKLSQPLIIASMTGGVSHAQTINANLAEAAEVTRIALSVGSQRIALEKEEAIKSFAIVREKAPNAVIFANMAAVQLNYGYTVEHYRRVVDMVQAQAVYLHLNPLQEALQPNGDTDFSDLSRKIEDLVKNIGVPIFVKEVGHGLSEKIAQRLVDMGVRGIDVAGTGGLSWAWIEATNSQQAEMADWFKNTGLSTRELVKKISHAVKPPILVASGGIRNPVQGLKAGLLGANFYSAATPFLQPAMDSAEAVIDLINKWQKGLQVGMFIIGANNWKEVKSRIANSDLNDAD